MKKPILFLCALFLSAAAAAAKPFVVPELREWTDAKGGFRVERTLTIAVATTHQTALLSVANGLAEDMQAMFGFKPKVSVASAAPKGSIFLTLGDAGNPNAEAYRLTIGASGVAVQANEPVGAYWATRTVLQLTEQNRTLPAGVAVDWPAYPMRGFMLDVGRKFFPIEFLEQYVKFMSYYKMNTFQIHLNDNAFPQFFDNDWAKTPSGFRLQSDYFPGLASKDGHYTKDEFRALQKEAAARNFVTIIPEIDVPAHTLALAHYRPSLGSTQYGMDHLDLFNPGTYTFVDSLFTEYISGADPVFVGERVHIGTDEYSNKDQAVVEKFRAFTDRYIRLVEKHGKKAMLWGALTHARGTTPVKVDDVLMNCWYNGYAEPDSMMRLGYDVVSVPDGMIYIVPMAGYYYDYLNTKYLYEKWTPAHIGRTVFEEGKPQIKGGMFAVWNDHAGNGISTRDVHHRVWPAMQTLAVKMWDGPNATLPYGEFDSLRTRLSEAPGVNLLGRVPEGLALELAAVKPGEKTALNEVGYGYKVSMIVMATEPLAKGTVLSRNADAVFYLSDPEQGKVGFSRDGYLFRFDYAVPVGHKVALRVEGDSRATRLYVNGKLEQELGVTYRTVGKGNNQKMALVKTLQFPLAEFGELKGVSVTDFKVQY